MGELRRSLGLPSLSLYGIGLILGAGVYSIIGAAAGAAGPGLWLAFLAAAAIALLTGLSYAELAAMYPKAGAEYTYAYEAFPRRRWIASGTGYLLLAAGAATAATVAAAFGGYLGVFLGAPVWAGALAILALSAGVAVLGIRESAWANAVMTSLEVLGLLIVVGLAIWKGDLGRAVGMSDMPGMAAASALVFFAYLGFEDLANLAEEAKRPERDVPRAIVIAVIVTAVLYAAVGIGALALASVDELKDSDSPLATAAGAAGPGFRTALAAIALAATANTVLITVVALSRMLLALARGRHAPAALARGVSRRGAPWVATLAITAAAALFTPLGEVEAIGSLASFSTLLAFSVVNIVLIRLRFAHPRKERPFRVPWSLGRVPVLPVLGAIGAWLFASQLGLLTLGLGAGLLAACVIAAWLVERRRPATG